MSLPNVGLTGSLRSGKDSVADYLVRRYGYTRFAFGDGLKDVCRRLYPDQFVDARTGEARKPRALLQDVGQALRAFDGSVWVNECFRRITDERRDRVDYAWAFDGEPFRAVISDLRQPNEFTRCRSEGYVIIRVNAPVDVRLQRAIESGDVFSFADFRHETESHVDTFPVDYDVYNVGTLDELYAQIDAIIDALITEDDG